MMKFDCWLVLIYYGNSMGSTLNPTELLKDLMSRKAMQSFFKVAEALVLKGWWQGIKIQEKKLQEINPTLLSS